MSYPNKILFYKIILKVTYVTKKNEAPIAKACQHAPISLAESRLGQGVNLELYIIQISVLQGQNICSRVLHSCSPHFNYTLLAEFSSSCL